MENLKDYREKEQKMYIIASIFVLILFSDLFDTYNSQYEWFSALFKIIDSTLLSSIIYIFAFLADSLFSSGLKMNLLYGIGHLPGETIFSEVKNKNNDLRFTTEQILTKYKNIYEKMPKDKDEKYKYENSNWYQIYGKHRDESMIFVSNRDYLLCRDLYISTVVISICYLLSCSLINVLEFNGKSIFYLLFMLIVTNISAHIKGKRFALNVLAYDLNYDKSKVDKY